jgi:hypothetical protein
MLNDRRYYLAKVPEILPSLDDLCVRKVGEPYVVVLGNSPDAHFEHLPGWGADRHPNLAGYRVIVNETARFLAEVIQGKGREGAMAR